MGKAYKPTGPNAIAHDRHLTRKEDTNVKGEIKKEGSGKYNWGNLTDYEKEDKNEFINIDSKKISILNEHDFLSKKDSI